MRALSATPRQLGAAARAAAAEREGRGAATRTRPVVAARAAAARPGSGRSSSPPPSPRSRSAASTTTSTTAQHAVSSSSPVVAAVAAVEAGTKGGSGGAVADAEVLSKSDIPASIAAAQAALRAVAALESMTTQLESLTVSRGHCFDRVAISAPARVGGWLELCKAPRGRCRGRALLSCCHHPSLLRFFFFPSLSLSLSLPLERRRGVFSVAILPRFRSTGLPPLLVASDGLVSM